MASSSSSGPSVPVVFTTQTPYPLPTQKFMIPATWKRFQLSQLINKALSLSTPVPFDFLVKKEVLASSLGEWCAENGVAEEETLEIEYIESVLPPQKMSDQPHEDWVSSVSCELQGYFLTGSYDGVVRAFDYSQKLDTACSIHSAPISSICMVPANADDDSHLVASASHDLTAQLTRITLGTEKSRSESLATLHLHTLPLASIASNATGSHLLTASWDGLVGLWDTKIPTSDEVPEETVDHERKKRRKLDASAKPKRKAPRAVLKSHTLRVSRALFNDTDSKTAYSCGFDSTVRTWDIENEICTQTITASEKPFLDMIITSDGNTALVASTDRTVSLYDLRAGVVSGTGSLMHPATPSCVAKASSSLHQIVSGAYDGVVRLWDLRSTKGALSSFKAWDGKKKVLAVDWKRGLVGVGGEGGLEVWKAGEDGSKSG
ncbi:WD40-repeat-containing domain protein [Armillaria fumosa]|nr:WD40-repeat-containing domain protein [Armillaria fumosa]